jgi:hypothetical protein
MLPLILLAWPLWLLPWSTSLHEIGMGIALAATLFSKDRWTALQMPVVQAAIILAALWSISGLFPPDRDGPGHAWALAPFLVVPALGKQLSAQQLSSLVQGGLISFVLATFSQWSNSHHLTMAYGLLPALAVALQQKKQVLAGLCLMGILSARSEGALGGALATILALYSPVLGLTAGVIAGLLGIFLWPDLLGSRALLWTGGLNVAQTGPTPIAVLLNEQTLAWERLSPGYWFPYHAHDSSIQLLGALGPAGLAAGALLVFRILDGPGAAAIVGVLVGSLSQDVAGDLEVIRSVSFWVMIRYLQTSR